MAYGLPIILADDNPLKVHFKNMKNCIYFKKNNFLDLARNIEILVKTKYLFKKIQLNNSKLLDKYFSEKNFSHNFIKILKK